VPNADIDEPFIERVLSNFESGDMLLLQNEISGIGSIMNGAASRGMTIIMNPSPFDAKIQSYPLELVNILVVNEIESEGLSGESDPERAAWVLGQRFPNMKIVLTLGVNGSICIEKGKAIHQKAYPVQAVDTTAAGDTFMGYFLAGLAEGMTNPQAMDLASRAAAICVTRPGAAESIPYRAELRDPAVLSRISRIAWHGRFCIVSVVFRFDDDPELRDVRIGLVEASGLSWNRASLGLDNRFQECLNEFRATNGSIVSKERQAAVRAMLRKGKYRPAGRGNPQASIFLQQLWKGPFLL